uniref:Uncharacterized protein n=1 Tax=Arundo donax TaxID=35708 RepID=A0A0A9H5U4_ARUDO
MILTCMVSIHWTWLVHTTAVAIPPSSQCLLEEQTIKRGVATMSGRRES